MAEGHERGVDAVLERRPVAHEMEPEAGPLALRAHPGVGQPDLGHELPPRKFGENPRVDLVRLGHQRRQTLRLDRVRDGDVPAGQLERVVDEARSGHRLDHRADLLPLAQNPRSERAQGVRVRAHGSHLDGSPFLIEHVHIEPLA